MNQRITHGTSESASPWAQAAAAAGMDPRLGANIHRAGRFRARRGQALMQAALGWLSDCSPSLATSLGYHLISRTVRVRERPWQREIAQAALRRRLRVGADELALYEWPGSGQTVLLVTGWAARATHLGRLVPGLRKAGYRVISFDPPGQGESEGRRSDPLRFAAAVASTAQAAGGVDHIVSHSFGAMASALARRDWGTAVRSHVLISPFRDCLWFCDAFAKFTGLKPGILAAMRERMSERYGGRIDWNRLSIPDMLSSAGGPVLIIHDHDDMEVPVWHSRTLHQEIADSQLMLTAGLGHHKLLGAPVVESAVLEFLGQTAGSLRLPAAPPPFDMDKRFC